MWKTFKVNNKDTRTSKCRFYWYLFTFCLPFQMLNAFLTKGFLMFPRGSKGNIEKKRIKNKKSCYTNSILSLIQNGSTSSSQNKLRNSGFLFPHNWNVTCSWTLKTSYKIRKRQIFDLKVFLPILNIIIPISLSNVKQRVGSLSKHLKYFEVQ